MKKILLLSANPKKTTQLRVDEEMREIREGLQRSKQRDNFVIETILAVRYRDISRAILDYEPNIVHFSGHGAGEEGLVFEDETGQEKLVKADALANLFKLFADSIECVVLNACYSEVQAKTISQHIPYVVGMNKAIGDKAAIEFAIGFYDGLGAGKTVEFAYKLGCNSIIVAGIPEHLTPQLLSTSALPNQDNNSVPEKKISNYYVKRLPLALNCFQEIQQEGALLKIKAPQNMGKTLLLKQIFELAQEQEYKKVRIDLQSLEEKILLDYSQFLRWLCQRVGKKLQLENCLDEYWSEEMTANTTCTDYFEEYILEKIDKPLLLGIDNIDRIFPPQFKTIASDFFALLRSWHESAKSTEGNWKKLRLIVIYSTEDLPELNKYQSPFNIGSEVKFSEFNDEQIRQLAKKYGLNWSSSQVQQLKEEIGGHPYLVHEAIKYLKQDPEGTLTNLLNIAATDEGIYAPHWQHLWSTLEKDKDLAHELKLIVDSEAPVAISPTYLYKLDSMGLIQKVGYEVLPRCPLYRQYFRERLKCLANEP